MKKKFPALVTVLHLQAYYGIQSLNFLLYLFLLLYVCTRISAMKLIPKAEVYQIEKENSISLFILGIDVGTYIIE